MSQFEKYSKKELLLYARDLEFALYFATQKQVKKQTSRIILSEHTPLDFKMKLAKSTVNDCLKRCNYPFYIKEILETDYFKSEEN